MKPINEEIKINKMDEESLETLKYNLLTRLKEIKDYILSNLVYNPDTNKIEFKKFDKIDINTILSQLVNEFSPEVIQDLNVEAFLRKINQIFDLKRRNTKRKTREEFDIYFQSIEDRIEHIKSMEDDTWDWDEYEGEKSVLSRKQYEVEKFQLQVELVKLQEWVITKGKKVAIVFEGRDAAGKGSTIKRFIEYLNPKGFKVVTLGIPTEEEKKNWFARYEKHLPKPGEIVFFDRSWYNRGVVEPAMGYCTEEEYNEFIENVLDWEENLIKNENIKLIKFWFSITKEKQLKRFEFRKKSPLKYWKLSPNDLKVVDKWEIIGNFKNQMFNKTSNNISPWVVINSNDKKIGRLNAMRYVLSVINYDDKDTEMCKYYPEVVNILK